MRDWLGSIFYDASDFFFSGDNEENGSAASEGEIFILFFSFVNAL